MSNEITKLILLTFSLLLSSIHVFYDKIGSQKILHHPEEKQAPSNSLRQTKLTLL